MKGMCEAIGSLRGSLLGKFNLLSVYNCLSKFGVVGDLFGVLLCLWVFYFVCALVCVVCTCRLNSRLEEQGRICCGTTFVVCTFCVTTNLVVVNCDL